MVVCRENPVFLTVDTNRKNADSRRILATRMYPSIDGYDRDEYPYALTMEGGAGSICNVCAL
jgi:hypothetical protein